MSLLQRSFYFSLELVPGAGHFCMVRLACYELSCYLLVKFCLVLQARNEHLACHAAAIWLLAFSQAAVPLQNHVRKLRNSVDSSTCQGRPLLTWQDKSKHCRYVVLSAAPGIAYWGVSDFKIPLQSNFQRGAREPVLNPRLYTSRECSMSCI